MYRIKKILKEIPIVNIPYCIYRAEKKRRYLAQTTEREVRRMMGRENPKPIYIIRREHKAGFFSNFFFVLGHMIYAEEKGYIPVVDMKNYPTLYNERRSIGGTKNAWEYYFEQPTDISLDKAYKSNFYVLSGGDYKYDVVPYYEGSRRKSPDRNQIEYLAPYIEKYIHIRPELLQEAEEIRIQFCGEKVLGIHIRGTDMKSTPDHPVPPEVNQFIEEVEEFCTKNQVDHIFLCTDEQIILEKMREKYGEKLLYNEAFRSCDGKSVHKGHRSEKRRSHHYLLGKEVLMDMLILASCDYLLYGHSNVAYAALVFNQNKFKESRLIENREQDVNIVS